MSGGEDMEFYTNYFAKIHDSCNMINKSFLQQVHRILLDITENDRKVIIAGNGGSAAMSSHVAVDFTKAADVRAMTFSDADLITCFANDFGYEHWLSNAIGYHAKEGDAVILISSSGASPNIIEAANQALQQSLTLITFSGFSQDNPLRELGHANAWVDSKEYNIVEMTHHIWLLAIIDYFISQTKS